MKKEEMAERNLSKSVGACQPLAGGLLCRRERRKKTRHTENNKEFPKMKNYDSKPFCVVVDVVLFVSFRFVNFFPLQNKAKRK